MKIVFDIEWWRFWRKPVFNFNPFRWLLISQIKAEVGDEISIDGACGGQFVCVSTKELEQKHNSGEISTTDTNWGKHKKAWIRHIEWWGIDE